MRTLKVDLGERSYPIHIGAGLLSAAELVRPFVSSSRVMVVTNETVAPLYLSDVRSLFSWTDVSEVVLPDGEQYKTLDTVNQIYTALLEQRHSRRTTLIALGGGVIGDMTGFAAATYQRGVDFIQIPTTLLSQVDSSVGGKTGVNHALGKNMIGAFYQPKAVLIDTTTLKTLPERELSAGMAEVIKYGLIADEKFLGWLHENISRLRALDHESVVHAIETSCALKADIVARDERESGVRAILNLGHTFGHAIETFTGYGHWLHGEAVGAGMVMALDLSCELGWISEQQKDRCTGLIESAGLPTRGPSNMSPDEYLAIMAVDKKVVDGRLRLVLLKALGQATIEQNVPERLIRKIILRNSAN